jgi:hypothetical protein
LGEHEDFAVAVQREFTAPTTGCIRLPEVFDPKADALALRKAMKGLGTKKRHD